MWSLWYIFHESTVWGFNSLYLIEAVDFFCGVNCFTASSTRRIHGAEIIHTKNSHTHTQKFRGKVESVRVAEVKKTPLHQLIYGHKTKRRRRGAEFSWCLQIPSDLQPFISNSNVLKPRLLCLLNISEEMWEVSPRSLAEIWPVNKFGLKIFNYLSVQLYILWMLLFI